MLRRPIASDADAVFEYAGDAEVTRYMDWARLTSRDEVAKFFADSEAGWSSGAEHTWLIVEQDNERAVGAFSCRFRGNEVDFGYVLARRVWGHGYATEAGASVVRWLLSLDAVRRIWATCDYENARSARVLQKLGLTYEGIALEKKIRPNLSTEPRDALVYSTYRAPTMNGDAES